MATFSGLTIDKASTSTYKLEASATGLTAALTSTVKVTPGTATQLVVTAGPPGSVKAGAKFNVTVTAEDAFGNVDPTFAGAVSLGLSSNPGGATLGGPPSGKAAAGVATFRGLMLNKPSNGYVLTATFGSLTAGFSLSFDVTT